MVDTLTAAFGALGPDLLGIGAVAVAIGISLVALRVGYRVLQLMIIGNAGGGRRSEYDKADEAAEWRKDKQKLRELGVK